MNGLRYIQAAWVMVAAVQQNTLLTFGLPFGESFHQAGARMDIRPAARVGQRDVIFATDQLEQALEVDFLNHHFDVAVLVFPEGGGHVAVGFVYRERITFDKSWVSVILSMSKKRVLSCHRYNFENLHQL